MWCQICTRMREQQQGQAFKFSTLFARGEHKSEYLALFLQWQLFLQFATGGRFAPPHQVKAQSKFLGGAEFGRQMTGISTPKVTIHHSVQPSLRERGTTRQCSFSVRYVRVLLTKPRLANQISLEWMASQKEMLCPPFCEQSTTPKFAPKRVGVSFVRVVHWCLEKVL